MTERCDVCGAPSHGLTCIACLWWVQAIMLANMARNMPVFWGPSAIR